MSQPPAPARPVVLFFARHHAAGPVKTRLAAAVGAERAAAVYRTLAEQVWRGLEHPGLARWLLVEPAAAQAAAGAWLPGAAQVLGQSPGDLGARLAAGFAAAFAAGVSLACAVGSDAPTITAQRVLAAAAALAPGEGRAEPGADLVLIPSLDGGYALIGLRRPQPELFADMPWSTPELCARTRARAGALGLRTAELAPVRDLDTLADWQALHAAGQLDPGAGAPPTPAPSP